MPKSSSKVRYSDLADTLVAQNEWWLNGRVPDVLAYDTERPLARDLWRLVRHPGPSQFQIVLGPRRVGKTTAMYQTVRHLIEDQRVEPDRLWWMRVDHARLIEIELGQLVKVAVDAMEATPERPVYVFLDELTYASKWDLWLKTFYDERWPIRLTATSSSTAALREGRMESGVGRWDEIYLGPFLLNEYLDLVGHQVEHRAGETLADTLHSFAGDWKESRPLATLRRLFLLIGGFPQHIKEWVHSDGNIEHDEVSAVLGAQRRLIDDAVKRAVYQDIPQVYGIDRPVMLERVLYVLADQICNILSPKNVCQSLDGISVPTFEKYLSYLERSYLVFTLPNYSGSEESVQRRGRKVYFVDGAVRNAALQRGTAPLNDAAEMGLLLENTVAAHLHSLGQQTGVRVHHWREGNDEVDLIYNHPTRPIAFEIGSSPGHARRGVHSFLRKHPQFHGWTYLVWPGAPVRLAEAAPDGVGTIPIDLLLLAAGQQASRSLEQRMQIRPEHS